MKGFLERIKRLCEKFKFKTKKIKTLAGALLVVIIGGISISFYSYSNQYKILFSNLDKANLQIVVDTLKNEKVDMKIDERTNTVAVPKSQVDKLRLKLAPNLAKEVNDSSK
jgi:flagellar M-ring protein FliF